MLKVRHVLFGFALLVAIVANSQGQSQQPSSEQEAAAKHQEEIRKAATDKKIADFTELLFDATAALAGIAVLQLFVFGWQGKQLKRTVEHLVISERAHVSGGANHATTSDGRKVLIVTINNHGKTQSIHRKCSSNHLQKRGIDQLSRLGSQRVERICLWSGTQPTVRHRVRA